MSPRQERSFVSDVIVGRGLRDGKTYVVHTRSPRFIAHVRLRCVDDHPAVEIHNLDEVPIPAEQVEGWIAFAESVAKSQQPPRLRQRKRRRTSKSPQPVGNMRIAAVT